LLAGVEAELSLLVVAASNKNLVVRSHKKCSHLLQKAFTFSVETNQRACLAPLPPHQTSTTQNDNRHPNHRQIVRDMAKE
jgi:hypothetical protein